MRHTNGTYLQIEGLITASAAKVVVASASGLVAWFLSRQLDSNHLPVLTSQFPLRLSITTSR